MYIFSEGLTTSCTKGRVIKVIPASYDDEIRLIKALHQQRRVDPCPIRERERKRERERERESARERDKSCDLKCKIDTNF